MPGKKNKTYNYSFYFPLGKTFKYEFLEKTRIINVKKELGQAFEKVDFVQAQLVCLSAILDDNSRIGEIDSSIPIAIIFPSQNDPFDDPLSHYSNLQELENDIQNLQKTSRAELMECRVTLVQCGYNYKKALSVLRQNHPNELTEDDKNQLIEDLKNETGADDNRCRIALTTSHWNYESALGIIKPQNQPNEELIYDLMTDTGLEVPPCRQLLEQAHWNYSAALQLFRNGGAPQNQPIPVPSPSPSQENDDLVYDLMSETGLDFQPCRKLLIEANWDFNAAYSKFQSSQQSQQKSPLDNLDPVKVAELSGVFQIDFAQAQNIMLQFNGDFDKAVKYLNEKGK